MEEDGKSLRPDEQKIAPRRGTRPRLRKRAEGAEAPSGIPEGKTTIRERWTIKPALHRMNRTPFVRQYGILLTNGVLFMPKGVPNKRYTGEFKQEVVETMQREKLSYKEVARLYGITAHDRVASWERIYLEEGPEGLYIERRGRGSKGSPPKKLKPEVEEDLLAEVQRLRAENAYLKKLNALVAERVRQERKQK